MGPIDAATSFFQAKRPVTPCPLRVDAVDKVGDEQRAGNNRIQVPRFLNQCCAPDSYLESMLLTRPSKNVYRQHRSEADITASNELVRIVLRTDMCARCRSRGDDITEHEMTSVTSGRTKEEIAARSRARWTRETAIIEHGLNSD